MTEPNSSTAAEPQTLDERDTGTPTGAHDTVDGRIPGRLHALATHRRKMALVILLAGLLGATEASTTTPLFTATARVRIQPDRITPAVAIRGGRLRSYAADPVVRAELDSLASRDLKVRVVRRLRLDEQREFVTPAGPQGLVGALSAAAGRVLSPLRAMFDKAPRSASRPGRDDLSRDDAPTVPEASAVASLDSDLSLTANSASHVFTITMTSRSPQMAALVANTLAEEFVGQTAAERRATLAERLSTIHGLLADLDAQIDAGRRLATASAGDAASGHALEQRLARNEQTQNDLLAEQEALELLGASPRSAAMLVDAARVPARPSTPSAARTLLLALIAGVALALALAFVLDYLDDTIQTPEDITRKLHIPFLGLVPAVRGQRRPVLSEPVPHDFGEAYRALRTSLVFTSGGESGRMVAVTSAQALEGRTTTACNLAMVLAFGGSRVLLIDADMRHPGVHKVLSINNAVGLSHLLSGQARVREAIQRTNEPNLCVITAGRAAANPHELLASKRMQQLVANLKQGPFDWIVIDTPPVLAVPDAEVLAPLVDSVTLVYGADMTRRSLAEAAVRRLVATHPRVIGAVLNRVKTSRNKYYYSRDYGLHDATGYGTAAADASTARA